MLFEGRELQKSYGSRTVLDLDRFVLEDRRIYALLGPNGAGKTTLLHILSFLDRPTRGELFYRGRRVDFRSRMSLQRLRREVALVEQHPLLFTTTVGANVGYGLRVRGVSKHRRRRIVEECLDLVGMREFRRAKGWRLSGGETQRVALARALACSPRVLCLDEPTASVDAEHQIALEKIVADIHAQKKMCIVFCTHDHQLAFRLAQNTFYLYSGRLSARGGENIFSGTAYVDGQGRSFCRLAPGLDLLLERFPGPEARISLDAEKISLTSRTQGAEVLGPGRIIQVTDAADRFRVLVDLGVPVSILLDKNDCDSRDLFVGGEIFLHVPSEAVYIL